MTRIFTRSWWLPLGLLLILGAVNLSIVGKERLVAHGRMVLLELAPLDPRSLMQGDYMRLDTRMARSLPTDLVMSGAHAVRLTVDARGVATAAAFDKGGGLGSNEARMVARTDKGRGWHLGSDAFFFQEGTARVYEAARYGEYRVSESGESVLVALRDANLARLGPDRYAERWQLPEAPRKR
ncbi:MAG: GDYXXLXY domain-containing protein [Burkholderiales bacterium]